ncbi:MAG: TIGR01244 family sulfur transferase [Arenibacterium sp.]
MDIRQITEKYSVSPQIDPEDVAAIAAAGFTRLICNRPDVEVPPSHQSDAIKAAAEAAGLDFAVLELTHQTMSPDIATSQRQLIETAPGPVLAYCASGTRCSVIWAIAQAATMPTDDILAATAAAGYNLENLRAGLEQLRASAG